VPDEDAEESALVIVGRFRVEAAETEAFLSTRLAGIEAARRAPGCLTYTVSADPLEPGVVHLFEHWASRAALRAHLGALRDRPKPDGPQIAVLEAKVHQYVIGPPGRVGT
jgi:quinol monooxygenase YgiN